ncbi:MAG TPA: hypothetical protein VKP67_19350 [Xanthobacteraceae bacterium]|nr:hypothetical protein [Xanthobacteraceae bacterium]
MMQPPGSATAAVPRPPIQHQSSGAPAQSTPNTSQAQAWTDAVTQAKAGKPNLGPIINAYNNGQQAADLLQNPHFPHNRAIVSDLIGAEQQANAQLNTAIANSLTQAANQAGNNPTTRYAAIVQRTDDIESLRPHDPAFQTAVKNALPTSGWAPPTDWSAVNSPGSAHPSGVDPFNVIISSNSNVTLPQLIKGLEAVPKPAGGATIPVVNGRYSTKQVPAQWEQVGTATNFWGKAIEGFTGAEYADVQPHGGPQKIQQLSMRVGGTQTVQDSNINHFRVYQQQLPGEKQGAYFIAASTESFHWDVPALWNSTHDVVSFDQGAKNLLQDIGTAAQMQGWNMQVETYPGAPGTGSNGIHYDGKIYVVTLTQASATG